MAPKTQPATEPAKKPAVVVPKKQRVTKTTKPITPTVSIPRAKKGAASTAGAVVKAVNGVKGGSAPRKAKANLLTHIASDDNTSTEGASNKIHVSSTENEPTTEAIQHNLEQAKTLRYINAFLATDKDKHFVHISIDPLAGHSNWAAWEVFIELVLRMHQVWGVLMGEYQHLDPEHEMYVWYERMVDVTIAILYQNVSREIRENPCFMKSVQERNPGRMMFHLQTHYENEDSGVDLCRS